MVCPDVAVVDVCQPFRHDMCGTRDEVCVLCKAIDNGAHKTVSMGKRERSNEIYGHSVPQELRNIMGA